MRNAKKGKKITPPLARIATKAAGRAAHASPGKRGFLAGLLPGESIFSVENVRHVPAVKLPDEEAEVKKLKFSAEEMDEEDEVSDAENQDRRMDWALEEINHVLTNNHDAALRNQSKRNAPPGTPVQYAAEGPSALVASSSNTDRDLSFEQALQRSQSGDQKVFRQHFGGLVEQLGVKGQVHSAVGDWEDGAEHSVLGTFEPNTDAETLRYIAAWAGLLGNQRASLMFASDPHGVDSVYTVQVPQTDMRRLRADLSAAGVPFRTLVPGGKSTKVIIYDEKRRLRDNVAQFAGKYHAGVSESVGRGEYVGGGSRSEARSKYRKIIAAYEASRGRGRRPVQAGQAAGDGGGRGAAPAQA